MKSVKDNVLQSTTRRTFGNSNIYIIIIIIIIITVISLYINNLIQFETLEAYDNLPRSDNSASTDVLYSSFQLLTPIPTCKINNNVRPLRTQKFGGVAQW